MRGRRAPRYVDSSGWIGVLLRQAGVLQSVGGLIRGRLRRATGEAIGGQTLVEKTSIKPIKQSSIGKSVKDGGANGVGDALGDGLANGL